MIYLKSSEGVHIVILEPGNIDAMKTGGAEKTPNGQVWVAYTPDVVWLGEQIMANMDKLNPETIARLIEESQRRPEVRERPYHPTLNWRQGKETGSA
jgi:hypothetical protein